MRILLLNESITSVFVENPLSTLGVPNISRSVPATPGLVNILHYMLFFQLFLSLCTGNSTFQATHSDIVTDGGKLSWNFFSYLRSLDPKNYILKSKVVKYHILCQCTVIAGLLLVDGTKIRRCWYQSILGIWRVHC